MCAVHVGSELGVEVPCGPRWQEPRAKARVPEATQDLKEAESEKQVAMNKKRIKGRSVRGM